MYQIGDVKFNEHLWLNPENVTITKQRKKKRWGTYIDKTNAKQQLLKKKQTSNTLYWKEKETQGRVFSFLF